MASERPSDAVKQPATDWHDLTGFQRDVLKAIIRLETDGAVSGQDIRRALEADDRTINHGRLYPNLDTLVDKGLVEKGQRDRRTNFYSLTRRGRREIEARREWEDQYVEV